MPQEAVTAIGGAIGLGTTRAFGRQRRVEGCNELADLARRSSGLDHFGEKVTPAFEQGMKAFWEENEARETFDKPDPAFFGLKHDDVRARFAPYLARMERWAPWPKA